MNRIIISACLIIASAAMAAGQELLYTLHPPTKSLTETLRAAGNFKIFLSLLEKAGLKNLGVVPTDQREKSIPRNQRGSSVQAGPGGGPRYQTIFAPNDAAFAKLPPGALE